MGPGWALVGALATGAAKLAFRTQGLIILLSHEACSCSPQTTRGSGGHAHVRGWRAVFLHQISSVLGLEPIRADSISSLIVEWLDRHHLTFVFHGQSRKDLEACHIVTKVTSVRNWDLNLC